MDFLRRSIHNRESTNTPLISTPIPSVSRPTPSIQPPKKVIRALEDHRPQAPNELGFSKGDFFHVINEVNQGVGWYEANNPMTGARGLVPKSKFEEFNKSNAAVRMSQAAARTMPKTPAMKSPPLSPRQPVFYAVVQHDFVAERADELDAKSGDHISVVAQSNYEWFVAKPISRLGRPGLIPVSFVAIHEPSTGRAMDEDEVRALMERGDVPGVEEWKRSIIEYKAASISLGVIDDDSSRGPVPNSPFMQSMQETPKMNGGPEPQRVTQQEPPRTKTPMLSLPPGMILSGDVVSWHYEMDEYWFRIHALFQPDNQSTFDDLPPAKNLILFRNYNDFYDFQVKLLDTFPVEAGHGSTVEGAQQKRILPFMPGPAQKVDDKVTIMRKEELDQYLSQLCNLWEFGAEHVLRHKLIRDFFAPKAGDAEEDVDPAYRIFEERYNGQQSGSAREEEEEQIRQPFSKMSVQGPPNRYSDESNYEEEQDFVESSKGVNGGPNDYQRDVASSVQSSNYDRQHSSYARSHSPYSGTSRTISPPPAHQRSESVLSGRNYSAEAALSRSMSGYSQGRNDQGQTVTYTSQQRPDDDSPRSLTSNPSHPPSAASASSGITRNRSTSNANSPPISANNPNTAFVKIKIFDRLTQDLIALRVNPRVTHAQLMDKVRARLGDDVQHLAYRNSISNTFLGLEDDQSLKQWLEATDKHVLYAD